MSSISKVSLYQTLENVGQIAQKQQQPGAPLFGPLRQLEVDGIHTYLMPAGYQKDFDFEGGLEAMKQQMSLAPGAKVYWIGGDLTGIYEKEGSKQAIECLKSFAKKYILDANGLPREDRMLLSEYAGPEKPGEQYSAIRCVAKLIDEMPQLKSNLLAYGVVNSASWFKSIGSVPHEDVKHLYVVHGDRVGENDPWDSNGLARNALILEGGSRSLGYIFEIIANGGEVIGLHGFRTATDAFVVNGKPCLSAAKFVGDLCEHLKARPNATMRDVTAFWNDYIQENLPFNPNTNDAHTKQYFVDAAWKVFSDKELIQRVQKQFKGFSAQQFLQEPAAPCNAVLQSILSPYGDPEQLLAAAGAASDAETSGYLLFNSY